MLGFASICSSTSQSSDLSFPASPACSGGSDLKVSLEASLEVGVAEGSRPMRRSPSNASLSWVSSLRSGLHPSISSFPARLAARSANFPTASALRSSCLEDDSSMDAPFLCDSNASKRFW
eukprot:794779-Prorocentrum_minimum.AAC.3